MKANNLKPTVFVHIPKCAGTSFIYGSLRPNASFYCDVRGYRGLFNKLVRCRWRVKGWVFGGHMPYGIHRLLIGGVNYITFLRDPVGRAVSHYHYVRKLDRHDYQHPAAEAFLKYSLEEILQASRTGAPIVESLHPNLQTRFVAGVSNRVPDNRLDYRGTLMKAKRNLVRMPFFGLVEDFERCRIEFERIFDFPVATARRDKPSNAPRISTNEGSSLANYHELDLELYSFALAELERRRR